MLHLIYTHDAEERTVSEDDEIRHDLRPKFRGVECVH